LVHYHADCGIAVVVAGVIGVVDMAIDRLLGHSLVYQLGCGIDSESWNGLVGARAALVRFHVDCDEQLFVAVKSCGLAEETNAVGPCTHAFGAVDSFVACVESNWSHEPNN
jgi:hypothetical protein